MCSSPAATVAIPSTPATTPGASSGASSVASRPGFLTKFKVGLRNSYHAARRPRPPHHHTPHEHTSPVASATTQCLPPASTSATRPGSATRNGVSWSNVVDRRSSSLRSSAGPPGPVDPGVEGPAGRPAAPRPSDRRPRPNEWRPTDVTTYETSAPQAAFVATPGRRSRRHGAARNAASPRPSWPAREPTAGISFRGHRILNIRKRARRNYERRLNFAKTSAVFRTPRWTQKNCILKATMQFGYRPGAGRSGCARRRSTRRPARRKARATS